ncbi:MAG: hypothetical protein M0T85_15765 [Dehalococcoidales bacterium]|nr:hypothetical protein [Dehalococcoidales bacterium]
MSERINLEYYRNRNAAITGMLSRPEPELTVTHRWLAEESTERVDVLIDELEQARTDLAAAQERAEKAEAFAESNDEMAKEMIRINQVIASERDAARREVEGLRQALERIRDFEPEHWFDDGCTGIYYTSGLGFVQGIAEDAVAAYRKEEPDSANHSS